MALGQKRRGIAAYVMVEVNHGRTCAAVLGKLSTDVGPAKRLTRKSSLSSSDETSKASPNLG